LYYTAYSFLKVRDPLFRTIKNGELIIKVFYSPTDAQVNCLENNFKIYR